MTALHAAPDDLHSQWARVFIGALVSAGVRDFVVSPGSRSTPLALAIANTAGARFKVIVDERSASFFALGQARVSGVPCALLCTSGSAGAHYYPAILEAESAQIPLIVLTADRPWDLVHSRANQTLDQSKLFGTHVRGAFELGEPHPAALRALPRLAAQAVLASLSPTAGPVHVNARFRKPLEPVAASGNEPWRKEVAELLSRGAPRVTLGAPSATPETTRALCDVVASAERGLLLVGPAWAPRGESAESASTRLAGAVAEFLRVSGFAAAAESTSNLLHVPELTRLCAGGVGRWLETLFEANAPDTVITLGAPLTSSAWAKAQSRGFRHVCVSPNGVSDPEHHATDVILGDAASLLESAARSLQGRDASPAYQNLVRDLVASLPQPDPGPWGEAALVRRLIRALPSETRLFVGNSRVVREFDRAAGAAQGRVHVFHQRGLSGIDGLLAGAAGIRSAVSPEHPVVAVLGDVSALHDVGSLALMAECTAPLLLVVVNNGGGRIFEQLPVANAIPAEQLSRLFLTPPPSFLPGACGAFGVQHLRVRDHAELASAMDAAFASPRATVIEAMCPPGVQQ